MVRAPRSSSFTIGVNVTTQTIEWGIYPAADLVGRPAVDLRGPREQTAVHSKRVHGFRLYPSFDFRIETISLK